MFKKIRARITDRKKWPRCWWYPVLSDEVRHRDVVRQLHESYAKSINKTMFSLLGVGLYCLLKVFSESDKSLIVVNTNVQTPLVGTSISFRSFLYVAPMLLLILVAYLHILYGYWLQLERERREVNESTPKTDEPTIESIPALFSFSERLPRLFTNLIFYRFVPLILWIIAYKAFALKELIVPFFYVAAIVTLSLLFLQSIRCPETKNRWLRNLPRWAAIVVLVVLTVDVHSFSDKLRRSLDLQREDLHGAWLQGVDLAGADMNNANLQGANLAGANLQGANLQNADFQKANLNNADFDKADLDHANFKEAKETEPKRFKTAKNWERAFYSNEFLTDLSLSPTHNEDLEKIGNYKDGGKIAYIYRPGDKGYVEGVQHGLIAAKSDLPGGDKYNWEAAKKACDELVENGHDDWYLPSKDELNQLYLNRNAVGGFGGRLLEFYGGQCGWRMGAEFRQWGPGRQQRGLRLAGAACAGFLAIYLFNHLRGGYRGPAPC
jgi:hypothetical protein